MVDRQIIESWLNKANEDLLFAKTNLQEGFEFYPQICFYLHQSAGKYLKAYILSSGLNLPRVHDLTQLVQMCAKNDQEFSRFGESVKLLNPFYIGTRYPDSMISITRPDAEKALREVEEVAEFVKGKIS